MTVYILGGGPAGLARMGWREAMIHTGRGDVLNARVPGSLTPANGLRSHTASSRTTQRKPAVPAATGGRASDPVARKDAGADEGFFTKLTRRRLKRGVFRGVAELQEAINRFVA